MSDDPFEIATLHPGYVASVALALWGFALRLLIGRHYKAQDETNRRLTSLEEDVSWIKGRLSERDHFGRHTWPGDTE